MEHDFWHQRWAENQIGFHQPEVNPHLQACLGALGLRTRARIFVPLCGKTRDIGWLRDAGFDVVGVELSERAVEQLFDERGVVPEVAEAGALRVFRTEGIEIYAGDIFALDAATLGPVDAIYDRAALIALPEDLQARYAAHLVAITRAAPQLLITVLYDQSIAPGPPFSTDAARVKTLYAAQYALTCLKSEPIPEKLKGWIPARDEVWILRPLAGAEKALD